MFFYFLNFYDFLVQRYYTQIYKKKKKSVILVPFRAKKTNSVLTILLIARKALI